VNTATGTRTNPALTFTTHTHAITVPSVACSGTTASNGAGTNEVARVYVCMYVRVA
jgi:hypothetical protein